MPVIIMLIRLTRNDNNNNEARTKFRCPVVRCISVSSPNQIQMSRISGRIIQEEGDNNASLIIQKSMDHHPVRAEGGQHSHSQPSCIGHSRCCLHAGLVAQVRTTAWTGGLG